jgi:hypothetical protein
MSETSQPGTIFQRPDSASDAAQHTNRSATHADTDPRGTDRGVNIARSAEKPRQGQAS